MPYKQDENGIIWAKSTLPGTVEVAFVGEEVWMRTSEDEYTVLRFTKTEWQCFIEGAKLGEFNI